MPKAKPISLHPLSFEEALKAIIKVDHDVARIKAKTKPTKKKK